MTLRGNKNRVRELEYIMVIFMISQQMQPENTVNTIKRNALMTSQVFMASPHTDRQSAFWHGLKRLLLMSKPKLLGGRVKIFSHLSSPSWALSEAQGIGVYRRTLLNDQCMC